MSDFLLPLMAMGILEKGGFVDCNFFGCINDYERYNKIYNKYGRDE